MAAFKYTNTQLEAMVTHAAGGTPASGNSPTIIVNRALQRFWSEHAWFFKRKLNATFALDSASVLLPTDFGELVSLRAAAGSMCRILVSSLDYLNELAEATNLTGGTDIHVAPYAVAQLTTDVEPTLKLFVHPTPSSSITCFLFYNRRLDLLPAAADDNDATPDIPGDYQQALPPLIRHLTFLTEDDERAAGELEEYLTILNTLKGNNGAAQGPLQMANALRPMTSRSQFLPDGRITHAIP
jgi:hypothetical protein